MYSLKRHFPLHQEKFYNQNMTQELRDKLAKIYALVQHGGTEGEKAAAKNQLDKMLKKYNLEGVDLDKIDQTFYEFYYSSKIEDELFLIILSKTLTVRLRRCIHYRKSRAYRIELTHLEWVEVSCAYEYFRRHMKAQWNAICIPEIKKKRTAKTRNARRAELQNSFSARYFYLSGLLGDDEVKIYDVDPRDKKAIEDAAKLSNVKGGKLTKQVQTGHQLPPAQN